MKDIKLGNHVFHLPFAGMIPVKPEQRENLRDSIQEAGCVLVHVVLWQEKDSAFEHTVVDGSTRIELAHELGLSKENVPTTRRSFKSTEEAKEFCENANGDRRHDEEFESAHREKRRAERVARVQAARAGGKSIRAIAAEEGVGKSTIERDLSESEDVQVSHFPENGTPEPPETSESVKSTDRSQHVENTATVRGNDGKNYPAKKPPKLCSRCERLAPGVGLKDCLECAALRKPSNGKSKGKRKKPVPPVEVKDATGAAVPDGLRDVFADRTLPDLVEELESAASMLRPGPWTERAGKLTTHYPFILIEKVKEHSWECLRQLQLALSALKAGLPHAVCPKCDGVESVGNGKTCRTCRGGRYVPEHRYKELMAGVD